jgi:hypothetical protein
MQWTRACGRTGFWIAAALAASACGGDYWLGGRQNSGRPDGMGGLADGGLADGGVDERVLDADIVLTGDQRFELEPRAGGTCRVIGNGHSIRSEGSWSGRVSIQGCNLVGLGSASTAAIDLEMSDSAQTTLVGNTFDASGAIHLTNWDDSTTTFRNNVILASSTVDLDPSFDFSTPAFLAEGSSAAPKFFQGNRVLRSMCWFRSPNWLIGGDADADSNLLVGLRAGIVLAGSGIVVRGNYVHNRPYPGAGDESAMSVIYGTSDVLAEHNLLRSGDKVIRGFGGELRYNAVLDADDDAWLHQPFEDTQVHHNLFLMCHAPETPPPEGVRAGIHLVNFRARGIQIYNNTLDGGGRDRLLTGAAVAIDDECFLESLRSNLIFNVPYWRNDGDAAAVRPGITESVDPPPARIGYADYNLFFNPDAELIRNYAVAVPDRVLRGDPGFALHDAPAMGAVDAQLEPELEGPSNDCFPWSDDAILAGDVAVSTMLASLRAAYSPLPGSPVLGAGDPADGAGTMIGAIGNGSHPADRFASFGR